MRTLHRPQGRDALCSWCGDDNHVYEDAAESTHGNGKPGRLVTDFRLDCGRAGTWFREDGEAGTA
ncbi:hypothetical protein [Kitasatospora sp. NPDC050463]|uniref:hypothetical protein n=1 Tax=Kitasatospora sp. NPDC050463 TaxID=3155786 RepID=UPI0033DF8DE8